MSSKSLYILWDESQTWGLLAWWAARSLGLPFRLVQAAEVYDGLLQKAAPSILLVPGGSARAKAAVLGPQGMQNIRLYIENGGHYLGFCGGAGLGLSTQEDKKNNTLPTDFKSKKNTGNHSLGLCPWGRGTYEERLQHFMSGHLQVHLNSPAHALSPPAPPIEAEMLLPVWWPGRFQPINSDKRLVTLASYGIPGNDFWLADLPIATLPEDVFSSWTDLYGLNLSPEFLQGQPCVIHGQYGDGSYTLSYSHLETPASSFANSWFCHILRQLGGLAPQTEKVAPWEPNIAWSEQRLLTCLGLVQDIMQTGLEHGLLFKRTDWLYGWRTGVPGAALNNLHLALQCIAALPPVAAAEKLWLSQASNILEVVQLFKTGACNYLLAERLSMTLAKTLPQAVSPELLRQQRNSLFGPPMQPGGLYEKLISFFDELAFIQLTRELQQGY